MRRPRASTASTRRRRFSWKFSIVDVVLLVHHVQDHPPGRDEMADAVDVPVGIGRLRSASLEPDDLLDAEVVEQNPLLLLLAQTGIARRV